MEKNNEKSQIEKLKRDWQQMDELAGNPSLTQIEMKQQIELYEEKQKKRFIKELLLFLFTAISILLSFAAIFVQSPIAFIVIEVCTVLIGPIVYFILVKRKKKEEKMLI